MHSFSPSYVMSNSPRISKKPSRSKSLASKAGKLSRAVRISTMTSFTFMRQLYNHMRQKSNKTCGFFLFAVSCGAPLRFGTDGNPAFVLHSEIFTQFLSYCPHFPLDNFRQVLYNIRCMGMKAVFKFTLLKTTFVRFMRRLLFRRTERERSRCERKTREPIENHVLGG